MKVLKQLCAFAVLLLVATVSYSNANDVVELAADPDCSIQEYWPHPTNCNKYYWCINKEKMEYSCRTDTFWNQELIRCDFEDDVECVKVDCPPVESVNITHPWDCSRFVECIGGEGSEARCPVGLHFNQEKNVCENPISAGCDPSLTTLPPPTTEGLTTEDPTTEDPTTEDPTTDDPTTEDPTTATITVTSTEVTTVEATTTEQQSTTTAAPEVPLCNPDKLENVAHPDDCSKYYICVNGDAFEQDCSEGLHFNPAIGTCDTQENAKCDLCLNDEEVYNIDDPSDCSMYYICYYGEPLPAKCPVGEHYNPEATKCESSETAGCQAITTTTEVPEVTTGLPTMCTNASALYYLEHESDCEKYYICNFGNPVELQCETGYHFSIKEERCVEPEEANCPLSTTTTNIPSTTTGVITERCEFPGLYLVPHDSDCSQYYICDHFSEILSSCPAGLHFSAEELKCMDPETAQCEMETTTVWEVTTPSLRCLETEFIVFGHPTDCTRYYICNYGELIERVCSQSPIEQHFNNVTKFCSSKETAGCDSSITTTEAPESTTEITTEGPTEETTVGTTDETTEGTTEWTTEETTTTEEPKICPNNNDLTTVAHPTDCTKYYLCDHGEAIERTCKPMLHFAEELGYCDKPQIAKCEKGIECPDNSLQYLPHPFDCALYYICDQGYPRLMVCLDEEHFSIALKHCTNPIVARCPHATDM